MRNQFKTIVIGLLALLSLTAGTCDDSDGGDVNGNGDASLTQISGRYWVMMKMTVDGEAQAAVEDDVIHISFDDNGEVGLTTGCTHYSGEYTVVDGGLKVEIPKGETGTMVFCNDSAYLAQSDWLLDVLTHTTLVSLNDDELIIEAALPDGTVGGLELIDDAALDPYNLMGHPWNLVETSDASIGSDALLSQPADITFYENGKVYFSTGCNIGNTTYSLTETIITIDFPVTLTEETCDTDALQAIETLVLDVLSGNPAFDVDESSNSLTLTTGDTWLKFEAAAFL